LRLFSEIWLVADDRHPISLSGLCGEVNCHHGFCWTVSLIPTSLLIADIVKPTESVWMIFDPSVEA